MASQQPNAWQTANRSRNSNSASRTPQNRSGTQSPSQQTVPSQAVQPPPPVTNAWTQRSSIVSGSNGQADGEASVIDEPFQSVNGFNAAEVKAFLGRDVAMATTYKPAEIPGTAARPSSGVSGSSNMANNQPFFTQLAKQVATLGGGG